MSDYPRDRIGVAPEIAGLEVLHLGSEDVTRRILSPCMERFEQLGWKTSVGAQDHPGRHDVCVVYGIRSCFRARLNLGKLATVLVLPTLGRGPHRSVSSGLSKTAHLCIVDSAAPAWLRWRIRGLPVYRVEGVEGSRMLDVPAFVAGIARAAAFRGGSGFEFANGSEEAGP